MEITTYIENHTTVDLPPFKHPTKTLPTTSETRELYYSEGVSIPDKIIMAPPIGELEGLEPGQGTVKCCLMFGYPLRLKDWEIIGRLYPDYGVRVRLYRGNQVTQVSENVLAAKSYLKGQRNINHPEHTLIKPNQKHLESLPHMYTVQLLPPSPSPLTPTRILYFLPSTLAKPSHNYTLDCIKYRYFNHKMLQILSEYVSLQNGNSSCYKDRGHHQFQAVVYSGRVGGFEVFLRFVERECDVGVCESFVEKLTQISMTDKHLLDQVDPLDFTELKKQIRSLYLEQKRLRKSLTFDKLKIVQQIENALQFLNLKEIYPNKLTYNAINSEMLKKIRNQNVENKAAWIKEQKGIVRNLDARLVDLEATKEKYKRILLEQEKANSEQIQQVRNQIRTLQASIRYQQAQITNQSFQTQIHKPQTRLDSQQSNKSTQNESRPSIQIKKKPLADQTLSEKQELEELEKDKILKFQMIKAQFQMEKEFARRKEEYARAAEDLFNYLVDC